MRSTKMKRREVDSSGANEDWSFGRLPDLERAHRTSIKGICGMKDIRNEGKVVCASGGIEVSNLKRFTVSQTRYFDAIVWQRWGKNRRNFQQMNSLNAAQLSHLNTGLNSSKSTSHNFDECYKHYSQQIWTMNGSPWFQITSLVTLKCRDQWRSKIKFHIQLIL